MESRSAKGQRQFRGFRYRSTGTKLFFKPLCSSPHRSLINTFISRSLNLLLAAKRSISILASFSSIKLQQACPFLATVTHLVLRNNVLTIVLHLGLEPLVYVDHGGLFRNKSTDHLQHSLDYLLPLHHLHRQRGSVAAVQETPPSHSMCPITRPTVFIFTSTLLPEKHGGHSGSATRWLVPSSLSCTPAQMGKTLRSAPDWAKDISCHNIHPMSPSLYLKEVV